MKKGLFLLACIVLLFFIQNTWENRHKCYNFILNQQRYDYFIKHPYLYKKNIDQTKETNEFRPFST